MVPKVMAGNNEGEVSSKDGYLPTIFEFWLSKISDWSLAGVKFEDEGSGRVAIVGGWRKPNF